MLWEVWDGLKPFWENLLLPSEFQAPPWIISVFQVLRGPWHLGGASRQLQTPTWRRGRSDGCFVGSLLTSRSRISCFTQTVHILTGSGACFLLRLQIFQPCLGLKFPAVYFKIGSTYCGAHYGPEWSTMLPVSIWSSDLVVSPEK